MSVPQFTPGPWVALPPEEGSLYARIRGTRLGGKFKIANALMAADQTLEENEAIANARLIAAAPDLYEALALMVAWYGKRDNHGDDSLLQPDQQENEIAQAMRALAKARGETL